MGQLGDDDADKWGQIYAAGANTGRNTGPARISPLAVFYVGPYSYRLHPEKDVDKPGYQDSAEALTGCDKWRPATYELLDTDVPAFFHYIETSIQAHVKKYPDHEFIDSDLAQPVTFLGTLGFHFHLPVYDYALIYAYQCRLDMLYERIISSDDARDKKIKAYCKHAKLHHQQLTKFWERFQTQLDAFNNCTGAQRYDPKLKVMNEMKVPDTNDKHADYINFHSQVTKMSWQIYKFTFAEQINFMRSFIVGRSRYGSPAGDKLDYIGGYAIGC